MATTAAPTHAAPGAPHTAYDEHSGIWGWLATVDHKRIGVLYVFEPIITYRLLKGMVILTRACEVLKTRCIEGITPNVERMRHFVEHSIGIVTALVPILGYEKATEIAKEALDSGRGVFDLVLECGLMTRADLDRALNPEAMTAPR